MTPVARGGAGRECQTLTDYRVSSNALSVPGPRYLFRTNGTLAILALAPWRTYEEEGVGYLGARQVTGSSWTIAVN